MTLGYLVVFWSLFDLVYFVFFPRGLESLEWVCLGPGGSSVSPKSLWLFLARRGCKSALADAGLPQGRGAAPGPSTSSCIWEVLTALRACKVVLARKGWQGSGGYFGQRQS